MALKEFLEKYNYSPWPLSEIAQIIIDEQVKELLPYAITFLSELNVFESELRKNKFEFWGD
jgi:hypothetical protein